VTADRGYGEAAVDQDLHALGVERVAIPRKGQPGRARQATEHTRGFRRLVKWRTGCEGRISHLQSPGHREARPIRPTSNRQGVRQGEVLLGQSNGVMPFLRSRSSGG
jgi:IS5 family transposase